MAEQVFPTKGNLLRTKRSLQLARSGFDLLDRKRSILMREMTLLVDRDSVFEIDGDNVHAPRKI